ncbi:MAG: hypothetical protein ABUL62_15035 [Myxococcales bacterium]
MRYWGWICVSLTLAAVGACNSEDEAPSGAAGAASGDIGEAGSAGRFTDGDAGAGGNAGAGPSTDAGAGGDAGAGPSTNAGAGGDAGAGGSAGAEAGVGGKAAVGETECGDNGDAGDAGAFSFERFTWRCHCEPSQQGAPATSEALAGSWEFSGPIQDDGDYYNEEWYRITLASDGSATFEESYVGDYDGLGFQRVGTFEIQGEVMTFHSNSGSRSTSWWGYGGTSTHPSIGALPPETLRFHYRFDAPTQTLYLAPAKCQNLVAFSRSLPQQP